LSLLNAVDHLEYITTHLRPTVKATARSAGFGWERILVEVNNLIFIFSESLSANRVVVVVIVLFFPGIAFSWQNVYLSKKQGKY
jgi:hypothetical protein